MRRLLLHLILLFIGPSLLAQLYFPPLNGDEWETMSPEALSYCPERIDSLYQFLEEKNSLSFILLKDGRIVLEQYFDGHDQDSFWYWASAGKSLTSYLVGCAQEDGLLDIEDSTQDYLGEGWTSCTPAQEEAIKIRHQLSMSTGLDDGIEDQNCLDPECFNYLEDPEDRWAYYNGPYRILLDVLEEASGQTINQFTNTRIGSRIGMGGLWIDYVRWGKTRDLARFGLLALNEGVWDTDTILGDQSYIESMRTASQELNEGYGYLWWLNGSETFMLPTLQLQLPGPMVPDAPQDMYSALGKDDQKIYVVPSQGLVVVRQGNAAEDVVAGPSSFDNQLWVKINELVCEASALEEFSPESIDLFPNPVEETLRIDAPIAVKEIRVYDMNGRLLVQYSGVGSSSLDCSDLDKGQYILEVRAQGASIRKSFIKN